MNTLMIIPVRYLPMGRPCRRCDSLLSLVEGDYLRFKCGKLNRVIPGEINPLNSLPGWCPDITYMMFVPNEQN